MSDVSEDILPELKEIVGALLFAARHPVSLAQIRSVLQRTAETYGGATRDFAAASEPEIAAAVEALIVDFETHRTGLRVVEVAGGFRLENRPRCGPWLRTLLEKGRPSRLSQPALETLAIIAYRQPIIRAEIEAVRGVAVDQILRNLLDLGLIRIVGRSELPGRPWMFGTTQKFLEQFGLRSLEDLPGLEELRRINAERPEGGPGTDGESPTTTPASAGAESGESSAVAAEAAAESAADSADAGRGETAAPAEESRS